MPIRRVWKRPSTWPWTWSVADPVTGTGHRARKRFGQNFLHDANVISRIVAAIAPQASDHLVEIGPGQGALTRPLLATGCRLTAIEIDRDLAARLRADQELGGARIVNADALDVDLETIADDERPLRLLGNLPYNVSTPLLFHALDQAEQVRDMHFMLQKEVVDRMAAGPGSKTYGRLSVMLQYACRVEPLFVVRPGSLHPVPRVQSAVVRLLPRATIDPVAQDREALARVVTAAFGQRRKTLTNALRGLIDAERLAALDIDPRTRAERLAVADFVHIANALEHP